MDIEEKTFDDTVEEIIELLENRQYRSAREEILKNNGVDAAEILEEIIEELGKTSCRLLDHVKMQQPCKRCYRKYG